MNIAFFVAGSTRVGMGHLQRSTAVAEVIRDRGHQVQWYLDGDEVAAEWLESRGWQWQEPPIVKNDLRFDVAVIDSVSVHPCFKQLLRGIPRVVLLSPVCNDAELASEAYLRAPPDRPLQFQPIIDRRFSIVSGGADQADLRRNNRSVGVCLSGGKAPGLFDLVRDLVKLTGTAGSIDRLRVGVGSHDVADFRDLLTSDRSGSLDFFGLDQSFWRRIGDIGVFITADGLMVDEACARGIATVCLSPSHRRHKIQDLVEKNVVIPVLDSQSLPGVLKTLLQDSKKIEQMQEKSKQTVPFDGAFQIANAIMQPSLLTA